MLQKKEIGALVLPANRYWLIVFYLISICLSILALFVFLAFKYHNNLFFIVGVLLFLAPAIFFTQKINLFTKKAAIIFSQESIEIKTSDILNDSFICSDIKYFSVSNISVDKASRINFFLKNGSKKRYIFFKQLDNEENVLIG